MQAFEQDPDSNNYHVLMDRIGICSFEKLKRERQGLFRCAGYFIGIAAFRRRFNKTWCIAGWLSGKEDHPAIFMPIYMKRVMEYPMMGRKRRHNYFFINLKKMRILFYNIYTNVVSI